MRGIALPPRTEDFSADPVELFFDLGYVLAFSQLVGHLVHNPDPRGVGEAAMLFLLMWLPWSQLTWSANAVSGNGRTVRLLFLVVAGRGEWIVRTAHFAERHGLIIIALGEVVVAIGAPVVAAIEADTARQRLPYRSLSGRRHPPGVHT